MALQNVNDANNMLVNVNVLSMPIFLIIENQAILAYVVD